MTAAALSNHGGKMSLRLRTNEKRRPEKVSVLPARTPVGVKAISMIAYARTEVSCTGCTVSGNVAPKRGGVA